MNTELLRMERLKEAAAAFGFEENVVVKPIGNGLINSSYLVKKPGLKPLLLQQVNANIFKRPEDIQYNYELLFAYLKEKNFFIPPLVKTKTGYSFWKNKEGEYWRAFEYVVNSYSPDAVQNSEEAVAVAECFSRFTSALKEFPATELKTIIPGFHDLRWRYQQFADACRQTVLPLTGELKELVDYLNEQVFLVDVYNRFADEASFPPHVMHHDCKVSNILFDNNSKRPVCPVDFDTVMPGKFFSDLGDMIRTMCCTVDENSTDWARLAVNGNFYLAITNAYFTNVESLFTLAEKEHFHYAGLLLVYMQAL